MVSVLLDSFLPPEIANIIAEYNMMELDTVKLRRAHLLCALHYINDETSGFWNLWDYRYNLEKELRRKHQPHSDGISPLLRIIRKKGTTQIEPHSSERSSLSYCPWQLNGLAGQILQIQESVPDLHPLDHTATS